MHTFEPVRDFTQPYLNAGEKIYPGMRRVLDPGMRLRGWPFSYRLEGKWNISNFRGKS